MKSKIQQRVLIHPDTLYSLTGHHLICYYSKSKIGHVNMIAKVTLSNLLSFQSSRFLYLQFYIFSSQRRTHISEWEWDITKVLWLWCRDIIESRSCPVWLRLQQTYQHSTITSNIHLSTHTIYIPAQAQQWAMSRSSI